MLGKVLSTVGQFVVAVLAGVGVVTVWALWNLAGPSEKKTVSVPMVVAAPVPSVVPVSDNKAAEPVTDCRCGDGPYCVGPRGGRYCVTGSGGKRYKPMDKEN